MFQSLYHLENFLKDKTHWVALLVFFSVGFIFIWQNWLEKTRENNQLKDRLIAKNIFIAKHKKKNLNLMTQVRRLQAYEGRTKL